MGQVQRRPQPSQDEPPPSGPQAKISSKIRKVIADLAAQGVRAGMTGQQAVSARFSSRRVKVDSQARVQLYVEFNAIDRPALNALLNRFGAELEIFNAESNRAQVWVPYDRIEALSAQESIRRIRPPEYAILYSGTKTTQGDRLLKADLVRSTYPSIAGYGVKVGVISDGANDLGLAQQSGDLPLGIKTIGDCDPQDWGNKAGACNEGTAILEIIHDIAPGAMLAIAAASTSDEFIDAVAQLTAWGAQVIVDDLGYPDQPYFEDGDVAKAYETASAQGIVLVSSAGNAGERHYQGAFVDGDGDGFHNFTPGKNFLEFKLRSGTKADVVLQWSNRFGASLDDYWVYIWDTEFNEVDRSSRSQALLDPLGFASATCPTSAASDCTFYVGVLRGSFAAIQTIELFVEGEGGVVSDSVTPTTPGDGIFGHGAIPGVISVGSIYYLVCQQFGCDTVNDESSRGPSTILFPRIRQQPTPTLTAVDCVDVTGAGGFSNVFCGTSAAAPHVAGIAALMLQVKPGLSPGEVRTILESTTTRDPKRFDNELGWGVVDAYAAVTSLLPRAAPFILSNPTVSPGTGSSADSFYFRVNYQDQERAVPTMMRLTIDGGFAADVTQLESGLPWSGTYVYGPVTGFATGQHSFQFHFENGVDPAVDTAITSGPVVSPPVISVGGAKLSITAAPNPLTENTCTIATATLTDSNGQPLVGQTLTFSTDFPGALNGFPPPGCSGSSYQSGASGPTDSSGQVKKYLKPASSGMAVINVAKAGCTSATTTFCVIGIPGDTSASLYVVSSTPGSIYLIKGALTKGGQPLTQKQVVLTTSRGEFFRNGVSRGTTYAETTDGQGEFGDDNPLEIRVSNYTGTVVISLDYQAANYKTATSFLCSASLVSDQLKLFPIKSLSVGGSVRALAWTPDGSQLFAAPDMSVGTDRNHLYSWLSADWSQRFARTDLRHHGLSAATDAGGTKITIGEDGGGIETFDLAGNRLVAGDQSADVRGLDWVGAQVAALVKASGSAADSIKTHGVFWFSQSGVYSPILTFDPSTYYSPDSTLRYDPAQHRFAYSMTNSVNGSTILYLHEAGNPGTYRTKLLFPDSTRANDVGFSRAGDLLAIVGAFNGIQLLNTASLSTAPIVDSQPYQRVAFLKSLNLVAAGGASILKIYDLSGRVVFAPTITGSIYSLAWNDARRLLAVGFTDGNITVYGFDSSAPSISTPVVSPVSYSRGTNFGISATVSDVGSGVQDASVKAIVRDFQGQTVAQVLLTRGSGDSFSGQWGSNGTTGASYAVGIYAEDNAGNVSEVNPVRTLTFVETINAPTLTSVSAAGTTQVAVGWLDNSSYETGFRVERSLNGVVWAAVATTAPNVQSHMDSGLQPSTWYYYRVVAFNALASATSMAGAAQTLTPLQTLSVSVTGSGSVISAPSWITCSSGTCTADFTSGTNVPLISQPAAGWAFAGWGGDCSGIATCVVSMTSARAVTATFTPTTYQMSVSVSGSGVVTSAPAGIDCASGTCTVDFASGTDVQLTAAPASGWTVTWSGACAGSSTTCSVSMTGAKNVSATFTQPVSPPGPFLKVSPGSGATGQPTNPTLTWGTSTGAASYEYCIDTTNDNACGTWTSSGTNTSVALTGVPYNTTHYWHVRANSAGGTTYADASPTAFWSFTTLALPGAFNKTSPANAATGQSANPTLTWGASAGAASYEYCYDTSNDSACTAWTSTGTNTSIALSGLNGGTTYYWHVRALNGSGTTYAQASATTFWRFTTVDLLPFIVGQGPFAGNGGWFQVRRGQAAGFTGASWKQLSWTAYNAAGGAVHPAFGDVDGDGLDEVVLGLGPGGDGWIAVLDDAAHNYALLKWIQVKWTAYNTARGEVFPAVADLDGDGKAEIVAGLGTGGAGWIEIFDDAAAGYAHVAWKQVAWAAYNAGDGSTHPAAADIDGDGKAEIVLGLGPGGAGWLEVLDDAANGYRHKSWFQVKWTAYNTANGTTYPAAGDVDGDGKAEVVVGLGTGGQGWAEVFDDAVANHAHKAWMQVTWAAYNAAAGEVHPAVGNLDGDAGAEIVFGLGSFAGNGGWFEIRDDGAQGYKSLGWRNMDWTAFRTAGGATWPAIGKTPSASGREPEPPQAALALPLLQLGAPFVQ